MMKRSRFLWIEMPRAGMSSVNILAAAMLILALGLLTGPAVAAEKACPDFPKVAWWGKLNHDWVSNYVARKYAGHWMPYVAKWENELSKLKKIAAKGSAVSFRKQGIKLEGESLTNYIKSVKERVSINHCLANLPVDADAGNGLMTASAKEENKIKKQSLNDAIRERHGGSFSATCRDGTITRKTSHDAS